MCFLAACGPKIDGTPGKQGRAGFRLVQSLTGAPDYVDGGFLEGGATFDLLVLPTDGEAFVSISGSDPAVLRFSLAGPNQVHAQTGNAGSCDLQLVRADGSILDSLTLNVVAPAKFVFIRGLPRLAIIESVPETIPVFAVDSHNRTAFGQGAIKLTASSEAFVTLPPTDLVSTAWSSIGYDVIRVVGQSPGGVLTASLGGVATTFNLDVVRLEQVDVKLTLDTDPSPGTGRWRVGVSLNAGADLSYIQPVPCSWSTSSPALTVASELLTAPIPDDPFITPAPGGSWTTFQANGASPPFTVTCHYGSASYMLMIQ